ncbi:MAG: polysaccharide biosynthesis protein, partial [Clostridia bacterium]|nr:polysaccharide biosynthesis protein [Clostridia bacterium]
GAYNIYTYVYSISMAGFPIAVARLVSESVTAGKYKNAGKLFRISKRIFFVIGIFCTLLMIGLAFPYSKYVAKTPMNYISIITISPCIFMCCMMSAYRGFYEGLQDMVPTAVSQVAEAAIKMCVGLVCSYSIMRYGLEKFEQAAGQPVNIFGSTVTTMQQALTAIYPFAATGAVFGVTFGTVFGLLFLVIYNRTHKNIFTREELVNSPAAVNDKELVKQILAIAVPIAIGAIINNLTNLIDDATVRWRLTGLVAQNPDFFKARFSDLLAANNTADSDIPTYLYGVYNSVLTLKNLIPTITMALGTSAVPIMASLWSSGNKTGAVKSVESALRVTCLIGFPAGFGMAAVASPVLSVLYKSKSMPVAQPLLVISALGVIFFALVTPVSNMLQSIGRTDVPLKSVIFGSVIKTVLNFVLVGNPEINIKGAAYSSVISTAFMLIYNLVFLIRETGTVPSVMSVFVKPLICGGFCGGAAWLSCLLTKSYISSNQLVALIFGVSAGTIIYIFSLFVLKAMAKDDILMLPGGEKIAKVLEKFKILE